MTALAHHTIPCRREGTCNSCGRALILGEAIAPGAQGWVCASCFSHSTELVRILNWLTNSWQNDRQPPVTTALDAEILACALWPNPDSETRDLIAEISASTGKRMTRHLASRLRHHLEPPPSTLTSGRALR